MTDIIERLRSDVDRVANPHLYETQRLMTEAADEIERLRAEVVTLKQNLATEKALSFRNQVARLEAERDAAVKDAELYRWLRNGGIYRLPYDDHGVGPEFDLSESAIDAAKGEA